jgi:hypothetical protein
MAAKGQPIGAGAGQQRRGGMLPPSGGAPIEVTREVLEAERAAATRQPEAAPVQEAAQEPATRRPRPAPEPAAAVPAQPEPAAPAPVVVAPEPSEGLLPDTADPAEILTRCEQIILAARVEAEEEMREVESKWLSAAGPAIRQAHRTKAYKARLDASGKKYRSFRRWAQERCGVSGPHAYRMVNEGPVAQALAPLYTGPLTTRQVDVLAPILRQHGEEAVRRVWSAAESTGGTSAKQLEVKRDVLGLAAGLEDYEPTRELSVVTPTVVLANAQKAIVASDRTTLKEAAAVSPDAARQTMMAALKLASDLQSVLAELDEPSM